MDSGIDFDLIGVFSEQKIVSSEVDFDSWVLHVLLGPLLVALTTSYHPITTVRPRLQNYTKNYVLTFRSKNFIFLAA